MNQQTQTMYQMTTQTAPITRVEAIERIAMLQATIDVKAIEIQKLEDRLYSDPSQFNAELLSEAEYEQCQLFGEMVELKASLR